MPYINKGRRLDVINSLQPETVGELNFLTTTLVNGFIRAAHGQSYGTINAVVGVLECAKLELYRRIAVPYEDKKMLENGDVY